MAFDFKLPQLPAARIKGQALRAVAVLADSPPGAMALKFAFAAQLGIDQLAALPEADRSPLPADAGPVAGRPPRQTPTTRFDAPAPPASWPRTGASYAARYRTKQLTPRQITETALKDARSLALRLGGGPICAYDDDIALRAADAAGERYAVGRPLGPLDGVPIVVKEQTQVAGLPTRAGTAFLGLSPASEDATVVRRLREAGAVVLGSTPMTEYGMSPIGLNPQRAMPRNPHREGYVAGGSSTGTAVCVATGICPVGVANDGGGSIRIPAALTGVYGIKPTFGRISRAGDTYRGTMATMGPIAASTGDLAAFLDACAGPDPGDPITSWQPAFDRGSFFASLGRGVEGLRIGVLERTFTEATPAIAQSCRAALRVLERSGATLVPVSYALAKVTPAIGYLSIGLEALAAMQSARQHHKVLFGKDLWCSFASLNQFSATDYLDAQRLRASVRLQVAELFRSVDLLALPTTAITAPDFSEEEARGGVLDAAALHGVCRTTMLGNVAGLPCGTAPVGRDADFLPIGLQLVGDAWDEGTVLAGMAHLEREGAAMAVQPKDHASGPQGW